MTLKLAIGIPAYTGQIYMRHFGTALALGWAAALNEETFELYPEILYENICPVDYARDRMMKRAIEVGADWLLSIDADVVHEGHELAGGYEILRMIGTGHDRRAAVIGAAVHQRVLQGSHRMAYMKRQINATPEDHQRPLTDAELADNDGVNEVDRLATSLLAYNVGWIKERLAPPWFVFPHRPGTIDRLGEDLYFCDRVRDAGGRILCDARFQPLHLGPPHLVPSAMTQALDCLPRGSARPRHHGTAPWEYQDQLEAACHAHDGKECPTPTGPFPCECVSAAVRAADEKWHQEHHS